MAVARQRHDRSLVVAQARLVGALFVKSKLNTEAYIMRGELFPANSPLPPMPEVDAKIAEIEAAGGRLIVPVEG